MERRQELIAGFVARHRCDPAECRLVEQTFGDGTMKIWVERVPNGE